MILLDRPKMSSKIVVLLLCAGSQLWTCSAGHVPDLTIIRGVDAKLHEVPSMVYLSIFLKNGETDSCGGTLIHPQFVLTAAHCLENIDHIDARLGCHLEDCSDRDQEIVNAEFVQHPDYHFKPLSHDIGIIKLSKAADLKPDVVGLSRLEGAAIVHRRNGYYDFQNATTYGWGKTEGRLTPRVLQKLDGQIRPTGDSHLNVWFGRKDGSLGVTCNGDSGGPLFWNGVQIAVTCRGAANCERSADAVFTRVDYHRVWIDNYINSH